MPKPIIVCVCGTRPDTIKMAPVVQALREYAHEVDTVLVSTGQHREMLDQALAAFDLKADVDLGIMTHGQTLAQVTSRAMEGIDAVLAERQPQWVVAQGDTTTTFVASLAAFYRRIPFAHVEAGLRTDSLTNPFPEEMNRRVTGILASVHFPPTSRAAENLRNEGVPDEISVMTGNTGIDALLKMQLPENLWFPEHRGPVILVTTHRRENWGEPQRDVARALRGILAEQPGALAVVPMHKNPMVRELLQSELGDHPQVKLIEPPDYPEFVALLKRSTLVLTDSGGVQEEAPTFGKPILVLRLTTERPEGVTAGVSRLVGTDAELIQREALTLLRDQAAYARMANAQSPYGDGLASQRIRRVLLGRLGVDSEEVPDWT